MSTLPSDDLLYTVFSDSATISTTTVREDSLRSDELSRILFGSIKDTSFGLTNCTYYGQILLSSTPNLISDSSLSRVADSLVLSFAYSGSYGDISVPQRIHVYKLTEDMNVDSIYYSDRIFATDASDIEKTGAPYSIFPDSSVVVGSDTNATPQLRIQLNDATRDAIFDLNGQTEFASSDNWKSYFKGLKVTVDPATSGGAILYFSPTDAATRMTLYYHEGTEAKSYSFTLTGGARINHTEHDYAVSLVGPLINLPDQQFAYLQPLAGLKTKVSFPYLKHFIDSGSILVNKAELVVTVPTSTFTTNTPVPDNILLLAKNSSDAYEFPIDYYERNYGGAYNVTSRTYTFGITRTIQRILDGTATDNGYTLNILGSMVAGNSAVIGSGKAGDSQMKLKLYYTKLH